MAFDDDLGEIARLLRAQVAEPEVIDDQQIERENSLSPSWTTFGSA